MFCMIRKKHKTIKVNKSINSYYTYAMITVAEFTAMLGLYTHQTRQTQLIYSYTLNSCPDPLMTIGSSECHMIN